MIIEVGLKMNEVTWTRSDIRHLGDPVPPQCYPTRFAVAVAALILPVQGENRVLLRNPSSIKVNRWTFPFGAVVGEIGGWPNRCTLKTISERVDELASRELGETGFDKLRGEIAAQVGCHGLSLNPNPIAESYALKLSKTADVWTAHIFQYCLAIEDRCFNSKVLEDGSVLRAISLDSGLRRVLKSGELDSVPLAPNVVDVLSDSAVIKCLVGRK